MYRLLLDGLQSPINIGMILRVAESFGMEVLVLDTHDVLKNNASLKTISDFACGALQRCPPRVYSEMSQLENMITAGRLIGTTIEKHAVILTDFEWLENDIIAVGNEYDGLSEGTLRLAQICLRIPMPDGNFPKPPSFSPIDPSRTADVSRMGQASLNVAISAGILTYSAYLSSLMPPTHGWSK